MRILDQKPTTTSENNEYLMRMRTLPKHTKIDNRFSFRFTFPKILNSSFLFLSAFETYSVFIIHVPYERCMLDESRSRIDFCSLESEPTNESSTKLKSNAQTHHFSVQCSASVQHCFPICVVILFSVRYMKRTTLVDSRPHSKCIHSCSYAVNCEGETLLLL